MSKNYENTIIRLLILQSAAVLLLLPATSHSHAYPRHSDPKAGSTVTAPAGIRVWFDGDLEPVFSKITITDAGGRRVDKGDSQIDPTDPKLLHVGVPALAPGRYRVVWDVVSRGGHHTTGDFTFTVK